MGRDYTFKPKTVMSNDNGTNYCPIKQAFGANFITSKVVICQNDINWVSFRIGLRYRDLFKSICYGMCSIAIMAEYNKQKQWLDEIANMFPDISQLDHMVGCQKVSYVSCIQIFWLLKCNIGQMWQCNSHAPHTIMVVGDCMK